MRYNIIVNTFLRRSRRRILGQTLGRERRRAPCHMHIAAGPVAVAGVYNLHASCPLPFRKQVGLEADVRGTPQRVEPVDRPWRDSPRGRRPSSCCWLVTSRGVRAAGADYLPRWSRSACLAR